MFKFKFNQLKRRFFNPLGIASLPKKIRKLRRMTPKQILKLAGKTIGLIVLFFAIAFAWYSKDLPTPTKIKNRRAAESTQIYDRKGRLLYAISGDEKRIIMPFSEIPDTLKQATISVEDKNFYQHYGVDFRGILRAAVRDTLSGGQVRQGGSTITQQYVKNALLTSKKTFSRKFKELILSIEIEILYSKDQILEFYLNEIPYGSTAYGAEAAARTFFDKPVKDLNLAESAALAALPQAPTYYSPYGQHKDDLLKRKDFVLDQMAQEKYITAEQAKQAKEQIIKFAARREAIEAPHFVFYIREQLVAKYGEKMVAEGGLKVTTTLDLDAQKKAEQAIEDGSKKLDRYGANNAALVAIDPANGQILAMVGSRDYFNEEIEGQVNVAAAFRQPGSSFKPIAYATAFKDKYNPAFTLFDLSTDFGGGYTPDNYTGQHYGAVSIRFALANSLNISAVKTLALAGLNNTIATAKDLGITTLNNPDRYGLALVLGGGEIKLIELTGAYGVFANSGKYAPTNGILKVTDAKGNILEEYLDAQLIDALDPQIAYLIADILSDNEARSAIFGARNYLTLGDRRVGAKTGTTQEFHDAWTIGFTPQIAVGVWVGNTNNDAMKKGADGSVVAAPIWNNFMKDYLADKEKRWLDRPSGIVEMEVDKLSNKLPNDASPEKVKDIFASWQIPTEKDNIHIKVTVNKQNGKKATDLTPSELKEERTYTNIHSEMPQKSNWEGPVRAWAKAQGLINDPPTDLDDMYTLADYPVIQITSPADGSLLSGSANFKINASAKYGIDKISLAIDNTEITSTNHDLLEHTYDLTNLSVGDHTATAFAWDKNGTAVNKSIIISIPPDSQGPQISQTKVITTSSTATITWNTNEPADGQIFYGLTNEYGSSSVIAAQRTTDHSITLGGLSALTTYQYKIVSRDENNNSTSSVNLTFSTK